MHEMNVSQRVFVVIGNKFEAFCANEGAITVSQLSSALRQGRGVELPPGATFLPGQGLHESDINYLMQLAELLGLDRRYDFRLRSADRRRASGVYTHKHRSENSIISIPRHVAQDVYELDLMLDERSELMNDHQTGQHIQGMILIEAARQSFIAVTQAFFIHPEAGRGYYFVINAINTTYHSFVFPLGTTIQYHILEKKVNDPSRLYFDVDIQFLQTDRCATSVGVKFTAFDVDKLHKKEASKAEEALHLYRQHEGERLLASPPPAPDVQPEMRVKAVQAAP